MPIDVIGITTMPTDPLTLNGFSGFHARGLFYRLIKTVDPTLAAKIHDYKGIAPYSVSPIFKNPNGGYFIKFTSFTTRISKALIEALTTQENITISGKKMPIREIIVNRIDTDRLLKEATPTRRYTIEFITPTCFRRPSPYIPLHTMGILVRIMGLMNQPKSRYRYYPLPDPILMLRNLKRQWEQYTGTTIRSKRFTRWLEEGGIAVSATNNLKTHKLTHKTRRAFIVGFTGKVRISLPKDTYREEEAKIANALLKMGEQTQVGINRTAGFGIYKILRPEIPRDQAKMKFSI